MSYIKYTGQSFVTTSAPAGTMNATTLGNPLGSGQTVASLTTACDGNSSCSAFTITGDAGQLYQNIRSSTLAPNLQSTGGTDTYLKISIPTMEKKISHDMTEVRNDPGTVSASFDESYNNSMLTGVIWAMLGTTLLVYAFKNMD